MGSRVLLEYLKEKEQLYLNIFNKYVYHDARCMKYIETENFKVYTTFCDMAGTTLLSTQLLQMLMADTFAVDSVDFVAASCKLSDLVLNNAE
ncbi:hypothetical protein KY290_019111 [Solanum tuberosum]|uniref:Uncharacterized protein n=1 Tax=Solanum tuberosum TaxID=4113 RepID=A0ABQ7VG44_SOLTU|nr:hypothetical protein KY284_018055 [Solanum tuberosum]KAH0690867.1 hypothetical protein KY289_018225 [Solanum tuberosum]KAH0703793.1 hypothetical protein KY285_018071 [Solanum tuberosum]KAH0763038.1 hypothetical protein KY290_019111 [Solanum tuberosum]